MMHGLFLSHSVLVILILGHLRGRIRFLDELTPDA